MAFAFNDEASVAIGRIERVSRRGKAGFVCCVLRKGRDGRAHRPGGPRPPGQQTKHRPKVTEASLMQAAFTLPALIHEEYRMSQLSTPASSTAAKPLPMRAAALSQQLRDAQAQQALTDLFPHLRLEAYNALRELFPIQSAQ